MGRNNMNLKDRFNAIKNKIKQSKKLRDLYMYFIKSQIIPAELLSDEVLKMVIANFIKRAEEKGYTAGIDLPEDQIAEFILRIIRQDKIAPAESDKAHSVLELIRRTIFNG